MPTSKVSADKATKGLEILSDLKRFEAMQEQKLERARNKAEKDILDEKKKASGEIEKINSSYKKRLEKVVEKEKGKAKEQALEIFSDFKKREAGLRTGFSKNREKAAKAVHSVLLGGN